MQTWLIWNPQIGAFLLRVNDLAPPTKRDNLVVSMLMFGLWLKAKWGRFHDWCAMCQILRVSGLRGTQIVDIRQPRGRLDLEVDKQWLRNARDVHYCQWMSEMVLSRPPKGQESQIMTSMSCRATYQRFIPTSNRWLHGKVQYTTGSGGVLVCLK